MAAKMKMFLYEVADGVSLDRLIAKIQTLPLEDRVRLVSEYEMKLEEIQNNNNVFLMDFCKHRDSGPGRAKLDKKIQGFNLNDDESFGEMTAILYDPNTHFVVAQYNHYGPRSGSIASYLSMFDDPKEVIFKPRLKDNILAEIHKKQYNSSLSFRFSNALLTSEHANSLGLTVIVRELENFGDDFGEVEITLKKRRGKFAGMTKQIPFLRKLLEISNNDSGELISSAKVKGAMTPEDTPEILDILNAKIQQELDGLVQDPSTKMYSFDSRCKLLLTAFSAWRDQGIITTRPR